MKFNPRPVEDGLFDAAQLMKDGGWGGDREFVWDHGKYWPALLKMCAETREAQRERWKALAESLPPICCVKSAVVGTA